MKTATTNGTVQAAPVNGQPITLAECIDHEAMSYRSQGTPVADLIAQHLERLSQLVRWTGATTPREYEERIEVWDLQIADRHYDRGHHDGFESAVELFTR